MRHSEAGCKLRANDLTIDVIITWQYARQGTASLLLLID